MILLPRQWKSMKDGRKDKENKERKDKRTKRTRKRTFNQPLKLLFWQFWQDPHVMGPDGTMSQPTLLAVHNAGPCPSPKCGEMVWVGHRQGNQFNSAFLELSHFSAASLVSHSFLHPGQGRSYSPEPQVIKPQLGGCQGHQSHQSPGIAVFKLCPKEP